MLSTVNFSTALDGILSFKTSLRYASLALALVYAAGPALGQTSLPGKSPPEKSAPTVASGPLWRELTPGQQSVLAPLATSWDSLEPARKRKWMSVAQTYPQLAPAEQAKLQGRMAEWAALSPRDRALARLNYSESKKLPAADRAANWDAYKALPPEDRQKFVAKAASAPKSAALAPKRSTVDKVTPVPLTRRTPSEERNHTGVAAPAIDRKTLLPKPIVPPKPTASSPAS